MIRMALVTILKMSKHQSQAIVRRRSKRKGKCTLHSPKKNPFLQSKFSDFSKKTFK
jgi:hypothetical protein